MGMQNRYFSSMPRQPKQAVAKQTSVVAVSVVTKSWLCPRTKIFISPRQEKLRKKDKNNLIYNSIICGRIS